MVRPENRLARTESPKQNQSSPVKPKVEQTEYARNQPRRESKPREVMNYDKLGGLVEGTEEHLGHMTDAAMIVDLKLPK